jgi:hypothetical protein
MVISYVAIHNDLDDPMRSMFETSRAVLIRERAEIRGVNTRMNHDGDTSYLEAYIDLSSLQEQAAEDIGQYPTMDDQDDHDWTGYVDFLMDLEDSNLGYLLHEVQTRAEKVLVENLGETNDDSPALGQVYVDYRNGLEPENQEKLWAERTEDNSGQQTP